MMPVKWTVEDYHQMVAAGILKNRRVELLSGEILEMAPEGPLHRFVNVTAAKYLRQILHELAEVYEAHPVTLPDPYQGHSQAPEFDSGVPSDSEPEPDIAIVHKPDSRYLILTKS